MITRLSDGFWWACHDLEVPLWAKGETEEEAKELAKEAIPYPYEVVDPPTDTQSYYSELRERWFASPVDCCCLVATGETESDATGNLGPWLPTATFAEAMDRCCEGGPPHLEDAPLPPV